MPMLNEVAAYLERLEAMRGEVEELVGKMPAFSLNWRPLTTGDDHSTNSVAVLATHIAGAEKRWIHEAIGEQPRTRYRPAEFAAETQDPATLVALLQDVGAETRRVLSGLTAEQIAGNCDGGDGRIVPVRWAILHTLDHICLHLGHLQLTEQLWLASQN